MSLAPDIKKRKIPPGSRPKAGFYFVYRRLITLFWIGKSS